MVSFVPQPANAEEVMIATSFVKLWKVVKAVDLQKQAKKQFGRVNKKEYYQLSSGNRFINIVECLMMAQLLRFVYIFPACRNIIQGTRPLRGYLVITVL